MSIGEKERNKVALGASRVLTSKVQYGVIGRHMHPSVGRFKINKTPFSFDVQGPPFGIKTIDTIAQSIAPKCNYGVFNTKVLKRSLKGSYSSKSTCDIIKTLDLGCRKSNWDKSGASTREKCF